MVFEEESALVDKRSLRMAVGIAVTDVDVQ